jgi:hypothetical protein
MAKDDKQAQPRNLPTGHLPYLDGEQVVENLIEASK